MRIVDPDPGLLVVFGSVHLNIGLFQTRISLSSLGGGNKILTFFNRGNRNKQVLTGLEFSGMDCHKDILSIAKARGRTAPPPHNMVKG